MASEFLKKKAQERAAVVDKEYGPDAYGGSKWRKENSGGKKAAGGSGSDGVKAEKKASSFLQRKAAERAAIVDKEYGSTAYGGSKWRESQGKQTSAPKRSYYSSTEMQKNRDYLYGDITDIEPAFLEKRQKVETAAKNLERLAAQVKLAPENEALYNSYKTAYDNYTKLWAEFEPIQASYSKAVNAYNDEFSGWKGTIRDATEIDAALAALDEQAAQIKRDRNAYASAASYGRGHTDTTNLAGKTAELTAQLDEIERQRALLVEEKQWAEHFSYADLMDGADFEEYSAKGAAIENPEKLDGGKINNVVTFFRNSDQPYVDKYDYMTDDEVSIYNYILAKEGEESAAEYLKYMDEHINARKGKEMGEDVRGIDNWAGRVGATGLYGLVAGVDQFAGGVHQFFSREDLPTSAMQYGSQYIQEDLADNKVGSYLYNATTTIGNMAPSILASTVLGPAGLGVSGAVAAGVGSATMGVSAAGNAYGQALEQGYSEGRARTYSTLVGASEAALQYALGGVGKLGGLADDVLLAKVNAIDNALARVALTGAVKLGSEITEEELQNFLEPMFAAWIFNENYDAPTVEELVETAIVTALSTGVLEGGSIISAGGKQTANLGAEIKGMDSEAMQFIIEEGLAAPADSSSYILAKKLQQKLERGEAISDQEIGNLQQQNEQNVDMTADPDAAIAQAAAEAVSREMGATPTEAAETARERVSPAGEETPAQTAREASTPTRVAMSAAAAASVPYNVLNNAQKAKASVLDSLGYLDNGTRAFESVVETTGMSVRDVRSNFQTAYEAGLRNVPASSVSFVNPIQKAAYAAGLKDYGVLHKQAVERDVQMAKQAPVQNKGKSGFQYDAKNLPTNVSQGEAVIIDELSRMLGVSTRMVGQRDYNAKLTGTTDVEIASDFQTMMKGRKTTVIDHAVHEMAGHQVIKLAPVEGRAFMNAMYGYLSENLPDTVATLAEEKTDAYGQKDVALSTHKAMEEVVVSEIFPVLYSSDPAQFKAAMERVMNGKDEQAKKGARTFKEVLNDLWKKLKSIAAKLRGKGDVDAAREAEQAADRVKELRDMFEDAMRVAAQRVQNAQAQATKNTAQADGDAQLSLKNVNGKQIVWIENSGLTNKQLKNHTAVAEFIAQHIGEVYTIIESGQKVYIGEDLPGEYTHSKYTDSLRKRNPQLLKVKNKATGDLGLLIETATNRRWEKTEHTHSKDAKYGMYRYDSSFAFPVKDVRGEITAIRAYDAELLIRNASDGKKYLYDIVGIKENTADVIDLQKRETRRAAYEAASHGSASADSVAPQEDNVNREAAELSDKDTDYSLREKAPPKKVGIAYKVFYAKDGQLYPPMVANPGGAGTPVGVWLDADVAASAPPSKTGRPQVQAGGKGTNAGKMSLAFRPGWHLGDLPMATQFARKNPETGKKELFPADFVWAECEYAMDHDYQEEAMSYGYTEHGKFRHSYAGLPRLPEDGYYRYRTNPNPDTVPWVITGAMRVKRVLTDAETDKILRDAGVEPMKRQGGELNLEKLGLKAGEQYSMKDSNGRKLSDQQREFFKDSVIRDESGDLLVMYHGTMHGGFTVFDGGKDYWYFTNDKKYAYAFEGRKANGQFYPSTKEGIEAGHYTPKSYKVYLNVKNPFVTDDIDIIEDALYWDKSLPGKLREKGYDALMLEDMSQVIVLNANQIKDVENKTPTKDQDINFSMKDEGGQIEAADPVESKAFSAWFGDWKHGEGSKVVDNNGDPLVVYHGTGTTIEEFLPEFTGQGNDQYGSGFYFTTDKDTAERYTGATLNGANKPGGMDNPNVIPVYLNIRKPIVVDARETPNLYQFDVSPTMAARIIAKAPKIMDPEESILGDFIDEYWERGPQKSMITRLANEYDWTLGSLETDVFRGYPTEFRQAVNSVMGYDGVQVNFANGEKHFIAWFPNQIKHATENSGAFSADDNRIKFSMKEQKKMMRDNARLKEVNAALKAQLQTTKFAKVDPKALRSMARDLLKDYDSDADIDDIQSDLDFLYTYLANDDPRAVPATEAESLAALANSQDEFSQPSKWNTAFRMAYDIARDIVEAASVTDDTLWREYEGLRNYLRTTGISMDRRYDGDLVGYEGLNDFRKRNFGRIKIVNNGLDVNTAYNELAGMYPALFNDDDVSHPGDQLTQLADVLDSLEPQEVNPYGHEIREAATWLANDIMERFFELPQAKPTFADKAERRLTEQVIKDAKKMGEVRERSNERVSKIIAEYREKVKEVRKQEKAAKWEKVEKVKEHYREKESKMSESRRARVLRERIIRHASELKQKLLRATDKKHIPQELQGAVAKLLECINLESKYEYTVGQDGRMHRVERGTAAHAEPAKRTQAFAELQAVYAQLANELTIDPDLLGDDGLLNEVVKLADKPIASMTSAELQTIWETMRAVESSVRTANKTHNATRWNTVVEAAEALREDNKGKKDKVELRGVLGKGQKLTGLDMETPETYFHLLGKAGEDLFRMMRDAQDQHIRLMNEVSGFTHETLGKINVRKLESEMHDVTLGGDRVKLSTAQIMELYVLMKREQALDHIFVGGILPDVVSAKGLKKITKAKPARGITLGDVSEAVSKLTDEQRNVADKLQMYASNTLSKWGNKASMDVYGYEKFGEKNYWPIRVNRQEIKSDVQKDTAVTSLANRSFTKGTRPHANNSLRLGSIFDTFATHSSEMATYSAWLGTLDDINRIRNYTFKDENSGQAVDTVKAIIDTVHGTSGNAYLDKLLSDVTNGVKGTHGETAYMSGLVGNFKAAAVGANLRVIIQQPTAMLRAADMIGAQYLAAPGNPIKGWNKAKKYAPIAVWKDWGYFDINTGRQMKDVLFDSDTAVDRVKSVTMWGAGAMDSLAWGQLWNAAEAETKAKRQELNPGTEAFYEAVAKRFTEIVDHTQVVDGILQRSQIMRSADSVTKMATSFMGEPTKQYNMMMQAAYDAKKTSGKDRKGAVKKLVRTASVLAISGVANAMAQAIIDAVRDDDKEKEYWEKLLASFKENLGGTFNPVGYIPFAKDVLSILQGYDVTRMDMESIEKLVSAGQNMIKALSGEGKYTVGGAAINLVAEIARLAGIPVSNLKREITSFAMLAAVESDNYLMQYRMEKWMLNMNDNGGKFVDILFNAYQNDKDAYEIIYADMVDSGYDPEKIKTGMETRMKKDQGVDKVSDLEQRYLPPFLQPEYDKVLGSVKQSHLWGAADEEQRDNLEGRLYTYVCGTEEANDLYETIEDGKSYGIDETEYLLYKLALEMYDTPNKSGELDGAPTNAEKAAAILAIGNLSDSEIAYLWDTEKGYEAYASGVDMGAYVGYLGSGETINLDKMIEAMDYGIGTDTYIDFLDMLNKYDQPSKSGKMGSFTQDEATAAIAAMPGLSSSQRAYLWQSVNKSWKSKNNPWR